MEFKRISEKFVELTKVPISIFVEDNLIDNIEHKIILQLGSNNKYTQTFTGIEKSVIYISNKFRIKKKFIMVNLKTVDIENIKAEYIHEFIFVMDKKYKSKWISRYREHIIKDLLND